MVSPGKRRIFQGLSKIKPGRLSRFATNIILGIVASGFPDITVDSDL
jgi:hypothetical protein